MARRKQSMAEDVIDIVSQLHWGVGVSLAVVSYLGLHWYAGHEAAVATGIENLSTNMLNNLFRGFATLGQYIFPFIFGLGAFISVFNRKRRQKLYEDTQNSTAENPLDNISWSDFELLVGEHFRRQGYQVQETAGGADGGVDLVLKKNDAKYFVQCKQWKAYKVGVKIIRELLGVMVGAGATGGYVVTSGQFTRDAISFAKDNNIRLIDGEKLKQIITNTPLPQKLSQQKPELLCPRCGCEMVLRIAKKGVRAGEQFWGCSSFPKCRGTVPYSD